MDTSYKLLVNNSGSFELTESSLKNLDAVCIKQSKFHILKDNKPYKAETKSKSR